MKRKHSQTHGTRQALARPVSIGGASPGRDSARPLLLHEIHGPLPINESPPNMLVQGDNLHLLQLLRTGPLRKQLDVLGGIKLVYLDPPFAVGANFYAEGANGLKALAYSDMWESGLKGYLGMMRKRLELAHELMARDGCLFLHCDSRVSHHLRLMLDDIFGAQRFLGEIIWHYTGGGRAKRWFSRKHDSIFHYARSDVWTFDPDAVRVPYKESSGYAKSGIVSARGKRYLPHPLGTPVDDVWDIPMVNPMAAERCGYPTQKPLALLERIVAACSRPGDLVADFFCGSGTLALAASRLGRCWLCADKSPLAIHSAVARLAAEPKAPAFALASPALPKGRARPAAPVNPAFAPFAQAPVFTAHMQSGPLQYSFCPSMTRTEKGALCRISLDAFEITLLDALPADARLPASGLEWLFSWSLARPLEPERVFAPFYADAASRAVFWHARRCQKRGIVLCTPELPCAGRLFVTVVDIFGNSATFTV